MGVRVGLWRKLTTEELMLLNCGVGEDSWESLDCKDIQQVHSEGDKPWDFFGGNDAEAETPILWPPHGKSWLTGKEPDAGRDWGQEEKRTTEGQDGITDSMDMSLGELRELGWAGRPRMLRFMGSQRVRHDWAPEELNYQPYKKQSKQLQVSNWRRKSQWVHKGAIFVPCTLFNSFHIPNFSPVFISDKVLCNITTTQYFPSLSCCS